MTLALHACGDDPAPTPQLAKPDTAASTPDGTGTDARGPAPRACSGNGDCFEPLGSCDPLTKQCTGCLFEADCDPLQHCVEKACVPFTPCKNSLDCSSAKAPGGAAQGICDAQKGECVACTATADCPPDHSCQAQQCVPFVPCANSTQCPADQVCDPSTSRCTGCVATSDCGENQLCEAGQCRSYTPCFSDKQCTPLGLLCDTKAGKCARCLKNDDCPAVYHCALTGPGGTGDCVLDACQQGEGGCDKGAITQCNAAGDGFDPATPCPASTTCVADGGKAECKPWVCTPGAGCDGDKAVVCSQDGLGIEQTTDCAASGQKCAAGACKAPVCTAGALSCDGNTVMACSDDGLSLDKAQVCGQGQFCEDGACKAQLCAPGQPFCDGNAVKVCNAAGSGPGDAPAKDCGKDKCVAGACKPLACEANKTYCEGQAVKVCGADGLSGVLVKTCAPAEICENGGCKSKVCLANQPSCDGNTAKVCNASGTGYTGPGQDCGAQKCIGGACKTQICKPASQFCEGGKLKTCSPDGTAVLAESACGVGTYCGAGKTGDAGCQPMVCNPGQPGCNGSKAQLCNAEGSGYSGAATDCAATSQICSGGVCKSLVCDPQNPLYCDGNTAKKCENGGLAATALQTCTASQYCDKGVCQAQVCAPNAVGCNGTAVATCNAQGSGWLPGGVDCAAQGKACQAGVCAVTQVCGNGKVEVGEECDDGNLKDGDGCSATCAMEGQPWVQSWIEDFNDGVANGWSTCTGCAGIGCPKVSGNAYVFTGDWNRGCIPSPSLATANGFAVELTLHHQAPLTTFAFGSGDGNNDWQVALSPGKGVTVGWKTVTTTFGTVPQNPSTYKLRIENDFKASETRVFIDGKLVGKASGTGKPANGTLIFGAYTDYSCCGGSMGSSYIDDVSFLTY